MEPYSDAQKAAICRARQSDSQHQRMDDIWLSSFGDFSTLQDETL